MTQVPTLTSSDNGGEFGTSVAVSGNPIVAGAVNTSNMTETATLAASDGQTGGAFGDSVSISGNTIAAGAYFATDSSGNGFAGKAYVFVRLPSGWSRDITSTAELTPSDSELLNCRGVSIVTNAHTIVPATDGHNNFPGAADIFSKPSVGWANMTQKAELAASDGGNRQDFGFSAPISGDTAVIGSPNGYYSRGAAYVFGEPASGWTNMTQTTELTAPQGQRAKGFVSP
jgi:hypothetical protein